MTVENPSQPGPGGLCDTCGHFAMRHNETGCRTDDLVAEGIRDKPCECKVFMWGGVAWPKPWDPQGHVVS